MDEFYKALELYEKTFDESFPMFHFKWAKPDEVVKIINECVSKQKDVCDMGYLSLDEDVFY